MNDRLPHLSQKLRRRALAAGVSLSLAFAYFDVAMPVARAQAPMTSPIVAEGRLGTLPGAQANSEALSGHVRMLERSIDRAISDLQHGDLKAFVQSYKLMVDTYVEVADQLGDASESLGEARAQVIVARKSLESTASSSSAAAGSTSDAGVATSEMTEMREYLHGKIAAIRARLDAARSEDRNALLVELQTMVERGEQLEQMAKAVETTGRPLLPGLASSELENRLSEVEAALDEEKRMVELVGSLARDVTKAASKDLRSTMRFLEIDARIPREQLDQLQALRGNLQRTVRQIESTRDEARRNAMRILVGNTSRSTKKVSAEELLQRADRLLNRPTSSPSGNSAAKAPAAPTPAADSR